MINHFTKILLYLIHTIFIHSYFIINMLMIEADFIKFDE